MSTMSLQEPVEKPLARTPADLQSLTTERPNEASEGLDTKSAIEIARIINHEDAKVAAAVKKALPEIAQVIDTVARSLRDGGRLIYVGAGSSGRISALDASECPPTFSTAPQQVQYIICLLYTSTRAWAFLQASRFLKSCIVLLSVSSCQLPVCQHCHWQTGRLDNW